MNDIEEDDSSYRPRPDSAPPPKPGATPPENPSEGEEDFARMLEESRRSSTKRVK